MEQSVPGAHPAIETSMKKIRPAPLERLMARWFEQLKKGQLTIAFPSGHRQVFGKGELSPQAVLEVHDLRLILRMLFSGDLGLAESYLNGEWGTPDLSALLTVGAINLDELSDALNPAGSRSLKAGCVTRCVPIPSAAAGGILPHITTLVMPSIGCGSIRR